MGRFSHLLGDAVTQVTPIHHPVLPKKSNHFNEVAPVTPVTRKNSHFHTKPKNPSNANEIKLSSQADGLSRELYIHGVTGVTGATALKNNDNPGNTSIFEGVTGVTEKKCADTAGRSPSSLIVAAIKSGDPALIAAAVAADPDIAERAAIMEYDAGLSRRDAEVAALQDFLGEVTVPEPQAKPS